MTSHVIFDKEGRDTTVLLMLKSERERLSKRAFLTGSELRERTDRRSVKTVFVTGILPSRPLTAAHVAVAVDGTVHTNTLIKCKINGVAFSKLVVVDLRPSEL